MSHNPYLFISGRKLLLYLLGQGEDGEQLFLYLGFLSRAGLFIFRVIRKFLHEERDKLGVEDKRRFEGALFVVDGSHAQDFHTMDMIITPL